MFRRSRLTMNAPTTPNIANAITYGICSATASSFATTSTIATPAMARKPASTTHGHCAGRSGAARGHLSR